MEKMYSCEGKVRIKNANGTAGRLCSCGSWLGHWEKYSGEKSGKCAVDKCENDADVGAHITRPQANNSDYKTHQYIVPMCSFHNGAHGETFDSKEGVRFVRANVQGTCGS